MSEELAKDISDRTHELSELREIIQKTKGFRMESNMDEESKRQIDAAISCLERVSCDEQRQINELLEDAEK